MTTLAAIALLSTGPRSAPRIPEPPREFRAVWVATVDNIDWPSQPGLSVPKAKAELRHIFVVAERLHLNAVIFQVRPSCDALYPSKIEPWSEYLTGRQGVSPNPKWDPLQFAIDEAHARGIQLHAWFNPYRAVHYVQKGPCCATHVTKTHPELVREYAKFHWLDPGEPEVRAYTERVILDVVDRYDIDGVHLDDYFYPYPERGPDKRDLPFPDDSSYTKYRARGGQLARADWRRNNVDSLIEELYHKVKSRKRWVQFGISPFGIYRPGIPAGTDAGIDQYASLYADCRKWLAEGWCDYMAPQLYWKISQTLQAYPTLLTWWASQNPKGRLIVPGNFTSKVIPGEGKWLPQEILDQIEVTRKVSGASGNVHFSMKAFLTDSKGIDEELLSGPYRQAALPPAMPWLEPRAAASPSAIAMTESESTGVRWRCGRRATARWWVTYRLSGSNWRVEVLPESVKNEAVDLANVSRFGVAAVDRCGVEGPISWVDLRQREQSGPTSGSGVVADR